ILAFWIVLLGLREIYSMRDESVWDAPLREVANIILGSLPVDFEKMLASPANLARAERIAATEALGKNEMSFQIWIDRQSVVHSPTAPLEPLKPDFVGGFADVTIDGGTWRVYDAASPNGKVHVQVGKSPQQRADAVFL